ncbi:MAG: AMP-binding protein [Pseudomonadota bacterium]
MSPDSTLPDTLSHATTEAETLASLLRGQAARRGTAPAIREKRRGIWNTTTWAEVSKEASALAAGLAARGLGTGDRIALIGENRPRLFIAMAAIHTLGAVAVPLFQDSEAEELAAQLQAVEAKAVFAENQEQVDKLLDVLERCPSLSTVVYDDDRGMGHYAQPALAAYADLRAGGATGAAPALPMADEAACIFFTSGTAGTTTPVAMTHAALLARARLGAKADGLGEADRTLVYLPPGWMCQAMLGYVQALVAGHCLCCPESSDTLLQDMREIAPTYLLTTPRMLDAIFSQVASRMQDTGGLNLRLYRSALAIAKRTARRRLDGEEMSLGDRLTTALFQVLIYAPLRDSLGMSRIRSAYCTGDALDPETLAFFRALGINLKQLYGTTEGGFLLAMHRDGAVRADTVGAPLAEGEIKISEAGEILVRAEALAGTPLSDTPASPEPGWIATGDSGHLDAEGQLHILDRTDNLVRLTDGSVLAPRPIETRLRVSPYVREAVVMGEGRAQAFALIDIDTAAVGRWADTQEIAYTGHADLAAQEAVHGLIAAWVAEVNAGLARDPAQAGFQIGRFILLPEELSPEDGLLTRTGKLRRTAVAARFARLIEALDAGQSEVVLEQTPSGEGAPVAGLRICEAQVVGAHASDRRAA